MLINAGKKVRVKADVEQLIKELSELTGYDTSTIRNFSILLGLKTFARISEDQVRKGLPPTPFLSDSDFWRLHENARQSIDLLRKALEEWEKKKVGVYA